MRAICPARSRNAGAFGASDIWCLRPAPMPRQVRPYRVQHRRTACSGRTASPRRVHGVRWLVIIGALVALSACSDARDGNVGTSARPDDITRADLVAWLTQVGVEDRDNVECGAAGLLDSDLSQVELRELMEVDDLRSVRELDKLGPHIADGLNKVISYCVFGPTTTTTAKPLSPADSLTCRVNSDVITTLAQAPVEPHPIGTVACDWRAEGPGPGGVSIFLDVAEGQPVTQTNCTGQPFPFGENGLLTQCPGNGSNLTQTSVEFDHGGYRVSIFVSPATEDLASLQALAQEVALLAEGGPRSAVDPSVP